jgi:hypothetical protein
MIVCKDRYFVIDLLLAKFPRGGLLGLSKRPGDGDQPSAADRMVANGGEVAAHSLNSRLFPHGAALACYTNRLASHHALAITRAIKPIELAHEHGIVPARYEPTADKLDGLHGFPLGHDCL